MTMRALISADRPAVRIWHPDDPKLNVEIQFESQEAANTVVEQFNGDVEVRDRVRVRKGRSVLTQLGRSTNPSSFILSRTSGSSRQRKRATSDTD
jgi:hypothetical protein